MYHFSQIMDVSFDEAEGNVVRGPANRPLKLVHAAIKDGAIWLFPWRENDPRTGEKPWWV